MIRSSPAAPVVPVQGRDYARTRFCLMVFVEQAKGIFVADKGWATAFVAALKTAGFGPRLG